ncbi:MAG: hypothetical protein G01um101470_255, partial [Parcubacteria group bacterium Gr01-1014_70]
PTKNKTKAIPISGKKDNAKDFDTSKEAESVKKRFASIGVALGKREEKMIAGWKETKGLTKQQLVSAGIAAGAFIAGSYARKAFGAIHEAYETEGIANAQPPENLPVAPEENIKISRPRISHPIDMENSRPLSPRVKSIKPSDTLVSSEIGGPMSKDNIVFPDIEKARMPKDTLVSSEIGGPMTKSDAIFPDIEKSAARTAEKAASLSIGSRGPEGTLIDEFEKNTDLAKKFGWNGKESLGNFVHDKLYKPYAKELIKKPEILEQMRKLRYLKGITEKEIASFLKNPTPDMEDILLGRHTEMMKHIPKGHALQLDIATKSFRLPDIPYLKART